MNIFLSIRISWEIALLTTLSSMQFKDFETIELIRIFILFNLSLMFVLLRYLFLF